MVTPHKIEAMAGRKISKVVIGPSSYHGVMISNQGTAFSFGTLPLPSPLPPANPTHFGRLLASTRYVLPALPHGL